MTLLFCDGSQFPVFSPAEVQPFKGFCTADVFTQMGKKITYMPLTRWREIRNRQKLYANRFQAFECGFHYLGAVKEVFDSF